MELPGSRKELVLLLAEARKARGISIRRASALVDLPASTLQGWFEGRHLPTQALIPKFLDLLRSIDVLAPGDEAAWVRQLNSLRSIRLVSEAPYAGLSPYTSDQAALYFGRERSLLALIDACKRTPDDDTSRVVILLGESGSGKSSLLAAGLIGSAAAPLGPLDYLQPVQLSPAEVAEFEVPDEPTLLVIDQFEDVDRLPADEQRAAMKRLSELPDSIVCVLGLRADAIGLAMRDAWLAKDLSAPVVLGPLTEADFVRIIERPALRHGRTVSAELTQLLLRDLYAYGEPAPGVVLPLLSSTLRRLWDHAENGVITPTDYVATGGLWAALNREADSIYDSFTDPEQDTARRLILSLFNVDGAAALRRRIPWAALTPAMAAVAEPFMASRILTKADDHLEVSHDALLVHWRRLAQWVEEAQATLLLGRRIHLAAQLWDDGGRTRDALMPAEAQLWREWAASDEATVLSLTERAFIDASCALGEATVVEQRQTIRRIRRRQNVAIVAGSLALAMAAAAVFASFRSEQFRRQEEATTRAAQSRQVALISDEVRPTSTNLAGQLSAAAFALDDNVQTRSSVITSASARVPTRVTGPSGNTMVATTADGKVIVRADSAGDLTIWRDGTLSSDDVTVPTSGGQLFALSLREVGGRIQLIVGGQRTASVWDVTGKATRLAEIGSDTVGYSAAWQGDVAMIGTLAGTIRRIDLTSPGAPVRLPDLSTGAETAVTGLAANDSWILAGGRRDRIEVFGADGTARAPLQVSGTVLSMATSPDGKQFAVGATLREVTLWDAESLRPSGTIPVSAGVNSVAHLGKTLLIAGAFGAVEAYDVEGHLLAAYPGRSIVTSVVGTSGTVVAGSSEGETNLWSTRDTDVVLESPTKTIHYDVIRSDAGLLVGTMGGAVMMSETAQGWREIPKDPPPDGSAYNAYYAIGRSGKKLINQTEAGNLVTLELVGGRYRATNMQPLATGLVDLQLSPDGHLFAAGYRGEADYALYRAEGPAWKKVASLGGWPNTSAFSADGTLFADMTQQGKGFNLWRVGAGTPTLVATRNTANGAVPISFAFAPDGSLAIGDDAGVVTIYDLTDASDPKVSREIGDARTSLSQMRFTVDGLRLLAASREGAVWVWRKGDDGWSLDLQLRPGSNVTGVAAYGANYVMSLDDGRTIAWQDDPETALRHMCDRFGTPLSAREWDRLVPGAPFVDGCTQR